MHIVTLAKPLRYALSENATLKIKHYIISIQTNISLEEEATLMVKFPNITF